MLLHLKVHQPALRPTPDDLQNWGYECAEHEVSIAKGSTRVGKQIQIGQRMQMEKSINKI